MRTVLVHFVEDLDTSQGGLVSEQSALVSQAFCISALDQQGRKAGEVTEERRDVRIGD